jgi:hypothetical protein
LTLKFEMFGQVSVFDSDQAEQNICSTPFITVFLFYVSSLLKEKQNKIKKLLYYIHIILKKMQFMRPETDGN